MPSCRLAQPRSDRALLDVGLGGPSPIRTCDSLAGDIGHLLRQHFRLERELGCDFEPDQARLTFGGVLGF